MGMLSTDNKKNLAGSDQFATRPDQHQTDRMPLFVTEKKILCYYKILPKPTPYYLHCFTTQLSPFLTTMPIHFLKTIVG